MRVISRKPREPRNKSVSGGGGRPAVVKGQEEKSDGIGLKRGSSWWIQHKGYR